uniref:RNase H type-1 domain-containing protein n=1 Tax=Cacopsylla melanoneura TaxID=428564 RepID=A0A8D8Q989_9HEMI
MSIRREVHNLLIHGTQIKLVWIPGHSSIEGNDIVDKAARDTLPCEALEHYSAEDLAVKLKKQIFHSHNQSWINTSLINKLRKIKNSTSLWQTSLRNNKLEEISLTRLRIGHTRFTHEHLFKRSPRPSCDTCTVFWSVEHIFNCKKFKRFRTRLNVSEDIRISLNDNKDNCDKALKYIKMCNLYGKL